jgi:two-component system, OmpR family, osmolarity sensor histidine kinase EnvZ
MRIKGLTDTITTRLALMGVALALLSLAAIAAIEFYYRATYRDETSAQMAAFSIKTFRAAVDRLGSDSDIIISESQGGLGPRFATKAPNFSVHWQGPFIERNIKRALGEPNAIIEARNAPLSPHSLWIRFEAGGRSYWVSLPVGVQGRPKPLVLLVGATATLALLAVISGYILVVLPINRLRQIVTTTTLNEIDARARVTSREPREISDVLAAFDGLMARVSAQAAERDLALGAISHDLRSPLARLRMRLETQPSDDLRKAGVKDIETIDKVLSQFLAYVRGGEFLGAPLLVNQVVDMLQDQYAGKPVGFEVAPEISASVPSDAVVRILTNLIDNALQYGVQPVSVVVEAQFNHISMQVIDHGIGFGKHQEGFARSPFTRLDPSRSVAGSGLGLAIVDRLATAIGGTVQFERQDHSFSAIFTFPIVNGENTEPKLTV